MFEPLNLGARHARKHDQPPYSECECCARPATMTIDAPVGEGFPYKPGDVLDLCAEHHAEFVRPMVLLDESGCVATRVPAPRPYGIHRPHGQRGYECWVGAGATCEHGWRFVDARRG